MCGIGGGNARGRKCRARRTCARWARAKQEAEEPLKRRRRPRPPPEPARVSDLRRRGEENAGENDDRDQRHGEAVDGRDWAEWQRTAAFD